MDNQTNKPGRPITTANYKPAHDYTTPPNQIRKYRLKAGLSQQQLANMVGMSRDGIASLERKGNRPRDLQIIKAIALVLKTSVPEILGVEQDTPWVDSNFYLPRRDGFYLTAFKLKYSTALRYLILFFDAVNGEWRYLDGAGGKTDDRFNGHVLYWSEIEKPIGE